MPHFRVARLDLKPPGLRPEAAPPAPTRVNHRMKPRRLLPIPLLLFVAASFAAEIPIEFSGVLTAEGRTRIALTDTTKKATSWVEIGDSFGGYTVARYDPKEEAVFLKQGVQETRLGLVRARTTEARTPAADSSPGMLSPTTVNAIRSNLRLLAAAARQFQLERGVTSAGFGDLVGPDKRIKEMKPIAGENYSTLNFGPNVTAVSVTTSGGAIISLDLASVNTPAAPATNPPPSSATPAPPAPIPPRS
jgi:hypothetical protein